MLARAPGLKDVPGLDSYSSSEGFIILKSFYMFDAELAETGSLIGGNAGSQTPKISF